MHDQGDDEPYIYDSLEYKKMEVEEKIILEIKNENDAIVLTGT